MGTSDEKSTKKTDNTSPERKSKLADKWVFTDPKQAYRESYSSDISHGTFHVEEIGQAIPVHVFGGRDAQFQPSQSEANDDMSLMSDSPVDLGRLNTIKLEEHPSMRPEFTLHTAVDNVVPPRLKRRPVSEVSPLKERQAAHRMSLNLSSDLDKLMESATNLQLSEQRSGGSWTPQVNQSTESFQTAGGSSLSSQERETSPIVLPRRPDADSMARARHASQQYSIRANDELDVPGNDQHTGEAELAGGSQVQNPETPKFDLLGNFEKTAGSSTPRRLGLPTIGQLVLPGLTKLVHNILGQTVDPTSKYLDLAPGNLLEQAGGASPELAETISAASKRTGAFNTDASVPAEPNSALAASRAPVLRSHAPVTNMEEVALEESERPLFSGVPEPKEVLEAQAAPQDAAHAPVSPSSAPGLLKTPVSGNTATSPQNLQNPPGPVQILTPQRSKTLPAQPTLLSRSEISPSHIRDSLYTEVSRPDDNEYYDIEDPVLVTNPVRAKSVKESILMPKRKASKRKSARKKRESLLLKPFSYSTLIHLLESVNGTVIGEEFESLNLPIKEKQLIEKIVDSLSRLTLDMVIDEHRYEIGIERLEKAHRVLEGFL